MATVHVQAELTSEELIRAIGQLNKRDFHRVFEQVLALNAQRRAPSLSKDESALFAIINQGLSLEAQSRYDYLKERLQNETLTPSEHAELLKMIDKIENADARRIEAIGQLAALRNVPVEEVLRSLGLKPR